MDRGPSALQINLTRLLSRCSEHVSDSSMHAFIQSAIPVMKRDILALYNVCEHGLLEEYEAKVQVISDLVSQDSCNSVEELEELMDENILTQQDIPVFMKSLRKRLFAVLETPAQVESVARSRSPSPEQLLSNHDILMSDIRDSSNSVSHTKPDAGVDKVVDAESEKEQVTKAMLLGSKALKDNVLRINAVLEEDAQALDHVDEEEDKQVSMMRKLNLELDRQTNGYFGDIVSTFYTILLVCVVFFMTYIFIKIVPKPV